LTIIERHARHAAKSVKDAAPGPIEVDNTRLASGTALDYLAA
jgi:hypothetical protein